MIIKIHSKRHGDFETIIDDSDYQLMQSVGGKWGVSYKANRKTVYVEKRINDKIVGLHRFLVGAKKGDYVDHINHNTLDNRRHNLRICKNSTNLRNGRIRTNNTSGVSGVHWDKVRDKWSAVIKVNYKTIHLGRHNSFEDAVQARKLAEAKYFTT